MTNYDIAYHASTPPAFTIRHLRASDLSAALSRGWSDFWAMPSHLLFVSLFYPIAGLLLAFVTAGQNAFYLMFPLLSGFVLIGPFAAIGLYEMSRLRERGEHPTWRDAFAVLRSPGVGAILALGALLAVIFIAWLASAHVVYTLFFGDAPARTYAGFFHQVFDTEAGVRMIAAGNIIGFCFAVLALALSLFSFPLILDRHVGLDTAIRTSLRATRENPLMVALWGLMVAVLLAIGIAAALMGLAIVMPVLAHATWHLYRRTIGPAAG